MGHKERGSDGMSAIGATPVTTTGVGRNDPCPCGSGRKYKHCCQAKEAPAEIHAGTAPESPTALRHKLAALRLAGDTHYNALRWADAIPPYREIVRLDPKNAEAHHNLGRAYQAYGRTAEAIAYLRRAVELQPSFESGLVHLGAALLQRGLEPEALVIFRKLSRRAKDPLERRLYLAHTLELQGKPDEAEIELRRLIALDPAPARARTFLGRLLSKRGLFDEAADQLTQAIEGYPPAFQKLSVAKRFTDTDLPLLDRMRSLAEQPGLPALTRVDIGFGLGKAFDDLGDYAEAMRQYEAANRLKGMSERPDRDALVAKYDNIIARYTGESCTDARRMLATPACPGDDLPVLIVGMPRSGTTLVEQILSSHPAIAAGGELPFWAKREHGWDPSGIVSLETGKLSRLGDDYCADLRRIGPEALRVTDKRPNNFEAIGLIRQALPRARIIHCRRNPVDTCLSIFFTNFTQGHQYARDRGDVVFFYRQYERLMEHWRRVLLDDRFIEVQYETLVADRKAETRRLIAFCGLDWDEACLTPESNPREVKTASLWQARQPVYATSVERWRRYEPWLGELKELLPAAESPSS
jgi:tetratricopeptide (TPR) repeat protein